MSPFDDLERVDVEQHSALVHELARRHSCDRSSADDLAQDTWLVALERPPRDVRGLHAWFARVVRNLAIDRARQAFRRSRRERAAFLERHRDADDAPVTSADVEVVRRLLAALDEPYRCVLELHYLRQRTVPEIARELGLPAETVRTRIRRGLSRLRESFEREERRVSFVWLLLPRWLRPARLGGATRSSPLASWGTFALVGALATIVVWLRLGTSARETDARPESLASLPTERGGAPALLAPAQGTRSGDAAQPDAPGARDRANLDLTARFVDGRVAASIEVELLGAAQPRRLRLDADGRGRVADLAPGTWSVRAQRGTRKCVRLAAGDNALELVLPRGLTVTGRLLDASGAPVRGGEVSASWPDQPERACTSVAADLLGRYSLEDVDPNAWIGARAPGLAAAEQVAVGSLALDPDGACHADLGFAAASPAITGSVRGARGGPVAGALLVTLQRPAHVRFTGAGGVRATPERETWSTNAAGEFVLTGIRADERALVVSADGYAPRTVALEAGASRLAVDLEPGGDVRGLVVGPDGTPAAEAEIELAPGAPLAPTHARADALGRFSFTHVPSGPVTLRATWADVGHAFAGELALDASFARDGAVEARVELAPRSAVEGVLVDEDGRTLAGWDVELVPHSSLGLGDPSPLWIDRADERRASSDAEGRFALELAAPGASESLVVYAPGDADRAVCVLDELPRVGVPARVVVPRAPRAFRVRGRVLDRAGRVARDGRVLLGGAGLRRPLVLDADPDTGEFAAERLLPGSYQWAVTRRGQRVGGFASGELGAHGDEDFGDVVLPDLGRLEVVLACSDPSLLVGAEVELERGHLRIASPIEHPVDGIELVSPGHLLFPPLTCYDYDVRVAGPALTTIEKRVRVSPGETTVLTLSLKSGIQVPIRVHWPHDGRPERLFLVVRSAAGEKLYRWAFLRTDEDSGERTVGLEPGDYTAELETPETERLRSTPFEVHAKSGPVVIEGPTAR